MKTATELFHAYLASIQEPASVAALFAADGVLELPYLQSLGIPARAQGPEEIQQFITGLLSNVPDFRFKNIRLLIETPDQVFGEYDVEAEVLSTGLIYRQSYAGRLVAANGKITLLREAMDTVAAAKAFRITFD